MKYSIRILSLAMAAVTTILMSACGRNIYEEVAATAVYNNGTEENNTQSGEMVIVTDKNGGFTIEHESEIVLDDNPVSSTTSNRTNNNSTSTTASTTKRVTTTRPTTTKKKVIETIPSEKSAIINAYNNAANRTKAQNNMTVDKTNDVEIVIDEFAGSDGLAKLATNLAGSFMKEYNGQVVREVYVNGKPTKDTTTKDKKHPDRLAHDKNLFIPIMNTNHMSRLTPNDVVSATATRTSESTYKVVITIKEESTELKTPPARIIRGMDYFDQDVFDLKGFRFESGTVNYKNCVITATINADGYLDFVEHKMSVSSTDAMVSVIGMNLDAKLHGDYATTFKFYK